MNDETPQSKGGRARADKLSPERKAEIGRAAARRRWADRTTNPVHHALDEGTVDLVGHKFRCAVLDVNDQPIRVISGTEFMRVLGIYRSGALSTRRSEEDEVHFPLYLAHKNLRQYVLDDRALVDALRSPLRYRSEGGILAEGIPGHVLRRILNVWVRALDAGELGPSQKLVAQTAKIILNGLADLAIDALIDEATGYQKRRAHDDLQKLLAAYVLPEFRKYQTKYPISFYEQLYRVLGWPFDASSSARSAYIGQLTNKLIYDRLPPGVHEELRRKNPTDPATKRRKKKHFQLLTEDVGEQHLDRQLTAVITLLRATPSGQWKFFEMLFNQAFPPMQGELFIEQDIQQLSQPA